MVWLQTIAFFAFVCGVVFLGSIDLRKPDNTNQAFANGKLYLCIEPPK